MKLEEKYKGLSDDEIKQAILKDFNDSFQKSLKRAEEMVERGEITPAEFAMFPIGFLI